VTAFDRDTAVEALGDGRFAARFSPAWRVVRGPNGGYAAAVLVQAMIAAVSDPARQLRSLTVHYLRPPLEGDVEIAVTIERAGRGMSTVSARAVQEGKTVLLGLGALGGPYQGAIEYADAPVPDVPAPADIPVPDSPLGFPDMPFRDHFELRPALGPRVFSGEGPAVTGGWIRVREDRPLDAPLLVALTDSWWPAPYGPAGQVLVAPTIDLTVHLRAALPRPHDDVLIEVRSDTAADGYFEEDTRLFARDGTLLAHSRQLALAL
jgi:acyl-CoA thioesterase